MTTIRIQCNSCKKLLRPLEDLYNSTPKEFMAVLLSKCCEDEPIPETSPNFMEEIQ